MVDVHSRVLQCTEADVHVMFMICSCYVHVVHAGTTELESGGIGWNRAQAVELVEAEKQVVLAKSKAEIGDSETTGDIKRRHGIDTLHRYIAVQ